MSPGSIDLIFLILVFIILQAWWIIPLIQKNNRFNERGIKLSQQLQQLEKLYKK